MGPLLSLHILSGLAMVALLGAAYFITVQARVAEPAVALSRRNQQMRLERWLQYALAVSLLTGVLLLFGAGWGLLTHGWLLLKLVLFAAIGAATGGLQTPTQRRRQSVLVRQAAGDVAPEDAALLAGCARRESLYFWITIPAVVLIFFLASNRPF